MTRICSIAALIITLSVFPTICPAADQADTARALVEKAVSMVREKGLKETLEVINDVDGPLVKGDLYLFAMRLDNLRLAAGSPFNKSKLGTVASANFNEKMAEIAKGKGAGWVEYSWPKPGGEKPVPKRTFIMRVPGHDAYFGCGYYLR
jgi:hypothetical protein